MQLGMTNFSRVLIVLAALGGAAVAAPPAPARPGAPIAAELPAPAGPVVTLTSPGTGTRSPLRFAARRGTRSTLTMSMKMAIGIEVGGNVVPPTPTPAIRMVMSVTVIGVDPAGDMTYEMKTRKVEALPGKGVTPEVLASTTAALAGMSELAGRATVTSRGFARDVSLDVPATATQQTRDMLGGMKQSLSQLSAPLPEEPVGIGATWDTTTVLEQNGMRLTQIAHYTLLARTRTRASLGVTIEQHALPQTIVANGLKLELVSYEGGGAGQTAFDLGMLVPRRSTVKVHSALEMKMPGNDALKMKLDLEMGMTGK